MFHDLFVPLNYASVVIMIFSCIVVSTHAESPMKKKAFIVCMTLLMCCIGFLFKIEANTAETLIAGQKLVYAFVTHSMFMMLLFIMDYCEMKINEAVKWAFVGLNTMVTIIVLTLDHHQLFYKAYWAVDMGGYSVLEKEYGPVHTLAVALFMFYMAASVVIAIIFAAKNIKEKRSAVIKLMIAVALPCGSYLVSKLSEANNEIQPISFAAFALMVIVLIYKNNLYDLENLACRYSMESMTEGLIIFDGNNLFKGCNGIAQSLIPALKGLTLNADISRKMPVLLDYLDGSVTEFVHGDEIYDVSVRPIENNGKIAGRVIWMKNITMQRNYMDLLESQNKSLESKVVTLSDQVHRDELTGILNRRSFEEKLIELREKMDREKLFITAADLDGLKYTNDTIGHFAGDELIRAMAGVLTKVFGEDYVYRTGGDEFFVIIPDFNDAAGKIRASLEFEMHKWKGRTVKQLSFSYGFALGKDFPGVSIDELIIIADRAMYDKKREYYSNNLHNRRLDYEEYMMEYEGK